MSALFGFGQALLQALDPERAHDLAVKSLELGLYPRASGPDDPRLAQELWGLRFANPIGMAAGFDKDGRVPRQLLAMGFGFVEVGTLTPLPQDGNPRPRIFRSGQDRAIINRLGFNNEGHRAALARFKDRQSVIIGINLGAGRDSQDRVADYALGIERFAAIASYFTINVSSPNTPGLRGLQSPDALDALLSRVQAARKASVPHGRLAAPLLVKLSPDIADDALPELVAILLAHKVDGLIVSNSSLARDHVTGVAFARETGGLSGRPLFVRSTRMLAKIFLLTGGDLPLVGLGGIDSGETALAKIEAGASLVQLYTGLVFEGPPLIGRIKRALLDAMRPEGFKRLAALTGRKSEEWAERPLP